MQGSFGPYETSELGANRATSPPLDKRVENNLIASFEIKCSMIEIGKAKK